MVVDYIAQPQVAEVIRANQARRKHNTNTKAYKLRKLRQQISRVQTAMAAGRMSEHDILPKVYTAAVIAAIEPQNGHEAPSFKKSGKRAMATVGQVLFYDRFHKGKHQLSVSGRTRLTAKIMESALQIDRLLAPTITAQNNPMVVLNHLKRRYLEALQSNARREKRMAELAVAEELRLQQA
jgi:hypothetical protein